MMDTANNALNTQFLPETEETVECLTVNQMKCSQSMVIVSCPDYTKPYHHGFYCRSEICGPADGPLQIDGYCQLKKCGAGEVRRNAYEVNCSPCEAYTRPNPTRDRCIADNCGHNQTIDRLGHCNPCPDYHKAINDNKKCVEVSCGRSEIVLMSGECLTCPGEMEPTDDGRHCVGKSIQGEGYFTEKKKYGKHRRLSGEELLAAIDGGEIIE